MRISCNWLKTLVQTELSADQIAERLTAAGLEVDRVTDFGTGLEGVVIGQVVACRPHPDADRLQICEVEYGAGQPVTVVCGAANARIGLKSPLALPGSRLPGGLEIRRVDVRGIESAGMLCSESELGLGDHHDGLMELDESATVGADLAQWLGLPDSLIELELTPNRGDCLSMRGLARELAAILERAWAPIAIAPVPAATDSSIGVELRAPADCPRYASRVIEGLNPQAHTPVWMVEALRRAGFRALHPIVDIANYVMLELGQPMHAFDLDRIEGGVRVRRALAGERIELLDGQTVDPDPDMLLICDHAGPIALAGIMGGLDSAVSAQTERVVLESAWFDPRVIAGRARRLGLATESAHRFERGVDPALQVEAIERASALILEIAGGRCGPVLDVCEAAHLPGPVSIPLSLERVNRLLGTRLTGTEVRSLLVRLGLHVRGANQQLEVDVPTARRDLEQEVDLIEEVARMVGYDRLPIALPAGRLSPVVESERQITPGEIHGYFQARGFQEIIGWSFLAAAELEMLGMDAGAQPLRNPLSRDLAILRPSLMPGMLKVASFNARRQEARIRLFETGHIFRNSSAGFEESERFGLLIHGRAEGENWLQNSRQSDFFDVKGEIEEFLASHAKLDQARFERAERPWLHPGQGARLMLDQQEAGWLGQLHPRIADRLDFSGPVLLAELDLARVCERALPEHRAQSRFPAVRRDLALVVPEALVVAELLDTIRQAVGERLERLLVFDQYQGKGIEQGCKSIAIGLIIRDVSRTLSDQEVDSLVNGLIGILGEAHQARLRGLGLWH